MGNQTILGLDPGFGITGYGLLEISASNHDGVQVLEAGVLRSSKDKPIGERLDEVYSQLVEIIEEFSPNAMAVENTFSLKEFPKSGIFIGYVQGVVLLAAAQKSIPVFHYYPLQVKKALLGNANATKTQTQKMIQTTLNLDKVPRPDDVADALAVALCHVNRARWSE